VSALRSEPPAVEPSSSRDHEADAAFEALVVATSPAIYALALRLVGNEHDARDVVQETYLRAYRALDSFRGEAAVSTWLYRICANCASNHLRRRSRRPAEALGDLPDLPDLQAGLGFDAVERADDERLALAAALDQLPKALRAVIVLHDLYDLSHDAIAEELGISRAASKVRLHRARRRLRELLFPPRATEVLAPSEPVGLRVPNASPEHRGALDTATEATA
jgi:RNA polymerase sigma-70 factor (ECF subfamily)